MATPNYMKRITFLDGQILHDFHLNILQKNVSEAIKLKTTHERYDMYLLVSPYNYYFCESFIDESFRHASSTAQLRYTIFGITADAWISPLMELPAVTDEIYLLANAEEDKAQGASVKFYYRTAEVNPWTSISLDKSIYLSAPIKYIQIKAECVYTGTVRPVLYDYCLMWK